MDQNRTILVVDDDPVVCEAISSFLSEDDYRIITTARWTEAITILEDDQPDAILLDLHLPTVQGEALLEFIRELHHKVPVVIISTDIAPAKMIQLGEMGANGFIRKPFEIDDLLVVLEQVLADIETVPDRTKPDQKAVLQKETPEKESEKAEEEETTDSTNLPPTITPGAGIFDLERRPASVAPPKAPVRRRRKRKSRGHTLRSSRIRRLRKYVFITAFFIGIAYLLYTMRERMDMGFLGGITINKSLSGEAQNP